MIQVQPALAPAPVSSIGFDEDWALNGPMIAWTQSSPWQGSETGGSACKPNLAALQGAIGELYERTAFTHLEFATERRTLRNLGCPRLSAAFFHAFNETLAAPIFQHVTPVPSPAQVAERKAALPDHAFQVCPVFNLYDGRQATAPEIVMSMRTPHPDVAFYPVSDSVGCSFHTDATTGLLKASLEFVERQALLLHWLKGYCLHECTVTAAALPRCQQPLFERLACAGTLRFFQISPFEGLAVILAIFSAPADHPVRFSVASSADLTEQDALCGALLEMWQSYRFQLHHLDATNSNERRDVYEVNFMEANNPQSAARFHAWRADLPQFPLRSEAAPANPIQFMGRVLHGAGLDPWVFAFPFGRGSRTCMALKVFDPSGFLNMSVAHTNQHNPWAERFNLPWIEANCASTLPFP